MALVLSHLHFFIGTILKEPKLIFLFKI